MRIPLQVLVAAFFIVLLGYVEESRGGTAWKKSLQEEEAERNARIQGLVGKRIWIRPVLGGASIHQEPRPGSRRLDPESRVKSFHVLEFMTKDYSDWVVVDLGNTEKGYIYSAEFNQAIGDSLLPEGALWKSIWYQFAPDKLEIMGRMVHPGLAATSAQDLLAKFLKTRQEGCPAVSTYEVPVSSPYVGRKGIYRLKLLYAPGPIASDLAIVCINRNRPYVVYNMELAKRD